MAAVQSLRVWPQVVKKGLSQAILGNSYSTAGGGIILSGSETLVCESLRENWKGQPETVKCLANNFLPSSAK